MPASAGVYRNPGVVRVSGRMDVVVPALGR